MGAARNRHVRRALAAQGADVQVPPVTAVPRVRRFDAVEVDKAEFDLEYAEHVEENGPNALSERAYLVALIGLSLEAERFGRERRKEAKGRLVEPATHVPAGLAEASARLDAIKVRS